MPARGPDRRLHLDQGRCVLANFAPLVGEGGNEEVQREAHRALGNLMRVLRARAGISTHEVVNPARGTYWA
jgi:hypothetical protein